MMRWLDIARIDIKNKGVGNDLILTMMTAQQCEIFQPKSKWFSETGIGYVLEFTDKHLAFFAECKGSGELMIRLRGVDRKSPKGNRLPLWVDYTRFAVNKEVVFCQLKPQWHDKPYVYTKQVTDGEKIHIEISWSQHGYRGEDLALFISSWDHKLPSNYQNEVKQLDRMNILLECSEEFSEYAVVLLNSIYKNHPGIRVNTYVLYLELSFERKELIQKFAAKNGQDVTFINMSSYKNILEKCHFNTQFTYNAYLKMFVHYVLPMEVDRCLYLDMDTIINGNLYEFYCTEFRDNYLIACSHIDHRKMNSSKDKLKQNLNQTLNGWVNTGVLLINVNLFRLKITIETYESVLREFNEKKWKYLADQGIISYMFCDQTEYVDTFIYNCRCAHVCTNKGKEILKEKYNLTNIFDFLNIVKIIHYNGARSYAKPWDLTFDDNEVEQYTLPDDSSWIINREQNEVYKIWWKYAKDTPIYDILLNKMSSKKDWYIRRISSMAKRGDIIAKENRTLKMKLSTYADK